MWFKSLNGKIKKVKKERNKLGHSLYKKAFISQ